MVTTGGRLPLLRDRITAAETYVAGNNAPRRFIPVRTPRDHGQYLLEQLAALQAEVAARPADMRSELAQREVVAVIPHPGAPLVVDALGSRVDHVIGIDPDTGVVLIDAASASLVTLTKKIEIYADDASPAHKLAPDGTIKRAREGIVAPIELIHIARIEQLAGGRLRSHPIEPDRHRWFEVGCRGGYRYPDHTRASRAQLMTALTKLQLLDLARIPEMYEAAEMAYFFLRLTPMQLDAVIAAADCIFEVDVAPPLLRDQFLADDPRGVVRDFVLRAPPVDAPAVIIVDTGIASAHPMLTAALLPGAMARHLPSPDDTHGHGTKMAGLALYRDVGAAYEDGHAAANHWIQSARLLIAPNQGEAVDEHRRAWPLYTQEAIEGAELADPGDRNRIFALTVTRSMQLGADVVTPTTLGSLAIDGLAYARGAERLIIVSAGNARQEQWLTLAEQFPQGQLAEKVHDPAQAANVLTVGAFTSKIALPDEQIYEGARVVALARGGISPYTSCGIAGSGWPIKPDVVMEGGNLAISPGLPDAQVSTLSTLTTSRRFALGRPLGFMSMTSEATAHVARLAADIWSLEPDLRPATVRALIVHAASWTPEMLRQFPTTSDRVCGCGYGVPDEAFARDCATDRATIVIEDAMPNVEVDHVPRAEPPRRIGTPLLRAVRRRRLKLYRLEMPDELGAAEEVELRVTLSFCSEPNKFRKRTYYGLELKWDMQGPHELETQFLERVNHEHRAPDPMRRGRRLRPTIATESFPWAIGPQLRGRGTVQSDRWRGRAVDLAGPKLIAVIPVQGWWADRRALALETMRFSLVVTVRAAGIYEVIKQRIAVPVEAEVPL